MRKFTYSATAALGLLALAACGGEKAAAPSAPLVRTALVGDAEAAPLRYTGVIRARTESDLGFRVGGKVVQRLVDPGQTVRRGQVLMRIDAADLQLAASASRDQVRSAEAQAAQATAEEARQRRLLDAGAVSRSAYDAALAAAQSSRAAVDAARSSARQADNQASYGALIADADGVVTEVLAQPGQVVGAGTVVVRLARAGNREAAVAVPETQIAALPRTGQALPYGSTTPISAQLREVAGMADPLTRTFDARFVLSRSDLPLGSTVTVELPRSTTAEIQAPLTALHDGGAGPGVWVVQGGKVRFKPVRVIRLGEETAAIAAGSLAAGDRIVTLGANQLREGQHVRLAAATTAVRP
jgi:RND family efflux transporter MFP subunit